MSSRRQPVVPEPLISQIDAALAAVADAQAELTSVLAAGAPLSARREAHAHLRHAFDEADALLRRATRLARQRPYGDWAEWRHRLSSLDTARQKYLFAEQDGPGLLPIGSVRAVDTGMSGPAIGDLQHGQSRAPGAPPTYGLDIEALLIATDAVGRMIPARRRDEARELPKAPETTPDAPGAGHAAPRQAA